MKYYNPRMRIVVDVVVIIIDVVATVVTARE